MIKKTITYTDFNKKSVSEDLYFHLSMDVITDNLGLEDRLEALQTIFEGDKRELTTPEKQEVLDVVKTFIKLSYGVRSEDGVKFRQRPELWDDFRDSAGYDAFLLALFLDPTAAMTFMNDVMPHELIEKAREQGPKAPQDRLAKAAPEAPAAPKVSESTQVPFEENIEDDGGHVESIEDDGGHVESIEELEARLSAARAARLSAAWAAQG